MSGMSPGRDIQDRAHVATGDPPVVDPSRVSLPQLFLLTAELAFITLLIRYFWIGGRPFIWLSYLVVPGFILHALLPRRHRMGFFLALSVGGVALVAGPANAAWLLLVVAGFVGVALLRTPFWGRVSALLVLGLVFALLRVGGGAPWSDTFWPILASILMFRLMVFVYDCNHEKERPSLVQTFSYFLLLPNAVFPLFPVVDFKRFRSSHYAEPAGQVYQRGLQWMLRGIFQLVLYRIVYQFFTISPADVQTTSTLLQFMLSSYGLYLRVSGLFHLIIGQLLLFGFSLPETHNRYYLASSFTDFWRRINIYWKDFMLKLFYYPVYFRMKHRGPTFALVAATSVVFFLTWLLHAYQWFWLRGTALFVAHDVVFWAVLGGAVVVNSLWEVKHGRQRVPGKVRLFSYRWIAGAGRVLATFTVLCMLWSLWSADSLTQWLAMWRAAGPSAGLIPAVVPASLLVSMWASKRAQGRPAPVRSRTPGGLSPWARRRPLLEHAVALGVLVTFIATERTQAASEVPELITRIREDRLNFRDARRQERGYYEHLLNVNLGAGVAMLDIPPRPPDWVTLGEAGLLRARNDFLLDELKPNLDVIYKRSRFQTNRWSMRDKEYSPAKPQNTVRIAILGASHVMGAGVSNGETFSDLLEQSLNRSRSDLRYEILNYGRAARGALHHLVVADTELPRFSPDVVMYVAQEDIEHFATDQLIRAIRSGIEIPYPYLRNLVAELELNDAMSQDAMRQLLAPHRAEIDIWAETQLAKAIEALGSRAVAVYLPRTHRTSPKEEVDGILEQASEAGFETIDLRSVYEDHAPADLAVAAWDTHPNTFAHGLIADQLMTRFRARPGLLADIRPETGVDEESRHRSAPPGG